MISTHPAFIHALQQRLIGIPLPGETAHQKMMHAIRKTEVQIDPATTKDAAVLIVLFEKKPNDWHIVFIRRGAAHDQDKHAGQIAFPGGKHEPEDRDMMYTALREAEEETAIDLTAIDVLGELTPIYIPVSKFKVHPFVAYSYRMPVFTRQEAEVDEILEFALSDFLKPEARTSTRIRLSAGIMLNHVPAYTIQGNTIWGATAMIMSELLDVLG